MVRLICLVLILLFSSSAFAEAPKIRLLALKHSKESMADGDANLAIAAVKAAAAKGLDIKTIGNHFVNREGVSVYEGVFICDFAYDLERFQQFLNEQMKIDAVSGDTLVLFTIGHGFTNGGLHNLGQRSDVIKAIATAAEQNQQKTLWWQLSCHASAGLPAINSLPAAQQEYLSVLASSTPSEESAAGVQGKIMEKVFVAMAQNTTDINPDKNDVITGTELRNFLNKNTNKRGDLLFVKNMDDPIFGETIDLVNRIPIVDRNNPKRVYPKDYIPRPRRR